MNAITPNINYFAQYAEAASANQIEGKLLKFSKGDWTYGVDGLELPAGIRLVALMNTLTIGWQRWFGGKPTDTRFGLVANGYQPPNRQELGDQDSSLWEADANGDARDPWAFVNRFVLIRPDDSAVFTFSTSSRGGINAIGELCKKYSRAVPGKYPLVSLEVGSYSHSDRSIGKVKFPTFNVVEYVDAAPFDEARGEPAPPMGASNVFQIWQARPPTPPRPDRIDGPPLIDETSIYGSKQPPAGRTLAEIDDDIPFMWEGR